MTAAMAVVLHLHHGLFSYHALQWMTEILSYQGLSNIRESEVANTCNSTQ
jgi:hypothetical protein